MESDYPALDEPTSQSEPAKAFTVNDKTTDVGSETPSNSTNGDFPNRHGTKPMTTIESHLAGRGEQP